ncbi:hypothetical protein SELMODRAFT_403169 [Selaginella moellendorffii]|uniref:Uncharacterized protein n=1 Tax=Selaginella moellendorffii TaxID=88036 RepID=D8QTB4_SELML|nr:hypothetical protein SELMODRAFT_403169 [Selaginella moellendorffii]
MTAVVERAGALDDGLQEKGFRAGMKLLCVRRSETSDPAVANADLLLVLFSLDRPRLDPVILNNSPGVPLAVVLNKADLVTQEIKHQSFLDQVLSEFELGKLSTRKSCLPPDDIQALDDVDDEVIHINEVRAQSEGFADRNRTVVGGDWERYPYYVSLWNEVYKREEHERAVFGTKQENDMRFKGGALSQLIAKVEAYSLLLFFDSTDTENKHSSFSGECSKRVSSPMESPFSSGSHAGFLDEAIGLFVSMATDHCLRRSAMHLGCMIDLLGRLEAEELIQKLPPDMEVLALSKIFLNSCKEQGDGERGERAAEFALPGEKMSYLLLSNLYVQTNKKWWRISRKRKPKKRTRQSRHCMDVIWNVEAEREIKPSVRKKLAKQERFLAKLRETQTALAKAKKKSKPKRRNTRTTLQDLPSLGEFLPDIPNQQRVCTKKSNRQKHRQQLIIRETKQLAAVLSHPQFQQDPYAAVHQHLVNTGPEYDDKKAK